MKRHFSKQSITIDDIIIRCILVDWENSTQLFRQGRNAVVDIATLIYKEKDKNGKTLEDYIKAGDKIPTALFKKCACYNKKHDIAKNHNLFIFLSKYITRTAQYRYNDFETYSIADRVVLDNAFLYDKLKNFTDTRKKLSNCRDNFDYACYCDEIKKLYAGTGLNAHQFDQIVWFSYK